MKLKPHAWILNRKRAESNQMTYLDMDLTQQLVLILSSWKHLHVRLTSPILHLYSKKQDW